MQNRILLTAREQKYAATNHLVPHFHVLLSDDVDAEILEKAVHAALALHPQFRNRIEREEDGLFYYVYNEALPVVTELVPGRTVYYGTEEFGFYPWQIMCSGKSILLSGMHAVSDGTGYLAFLKSILHLYFTGRGHKFSPAASSDLKSSADPRFSPASAAAKLPCDPPGIPHFPAAMPADDSLFETDVTKLQPRRLILRRKEIEGLALAREVSTFSIISCYAARAVRQALQIRSGNIKVRVAMNLRAGFPCETDRNFSLGFSLNYDLAKMEGKPSSAVATAFRSQLDILSDRDNLILKLRREELLLEQLKKDPGKLDELQDVFRAQRKRASASISYTHITHTGFSAELEELIAGVEWGMPLMPEKTMVIFASSFKEEIVLNVFETLKGNALSTALESAVRADGIYCRSEAASVFPRAEHVKDQF